MRVAGGVLKHIMVMLTVFALLAAFSNSIHSLANKFLVGRSGLAALPATLLLQLAAGTLALLLVVITRPHWVPAGMPYIAAVALLSVLAYLATMYAFSHEDASTVSPILGTKVIMLALLESLLLGRPLGPGVLVGAVVSVGGIALTSQTDHWSLHPRDLLRPGIGFMLFAAAAFAACDLFMRRALAAWGGDSWSANLLLLLLMASMAGVLYLALPPLRRNTFFCADGCPLSWAAVRPAMPVLLLSAVTLILTQYFIFTSFAVGGQVTLSNILYNTRSLFVVAMAAVLVLGHGSTLERAGWRAYAYRISGALLTLTAIALALLVK